MIVFTFIALAIGAFKCVDGSIYGYPGSFSFFQPKLRDSQLMAASDGASESEETEYGPLDKESTSVLLSEADPSVNMTQVLNKLVQVSDASDEKYRKYIKKSGLVVLSFPYFPFGWSNYPFRMKIKTRSSLGSVNKLSKMNKTSKKKGKKVIKREGNTNRGSQVLGQVELYSTRPMAAGSPIGSKRIRVQFQVELVDGKKLILVRRCAAKGLSVGKTELVAETLEHFLKLDLLAEIELAEARMHQLARHQQLSKLSKKAKQAKSRDMILNPAKYKNKSPTVRRVGSGGSSGGSGRYTPSADTQARRQVRRS
mmetsp:Transcript_1669/g.2728  ORF Transcript_1669/g.2728 Transcript_1669/m.2728 type:complete len:311 (+) Transcript_1669:126-1058(+)|eukprot:CAMPEP_0174962270 /NCGR_PEP_ID=MMETSP0004_2-20121128/4692_1 /TAXON_ID=420556 /ORGANISM="Ochromonas sp., Strain CCMP1393" /LENGTH=310 /DNA_ID=CAMNT_0016210787 /DNA_START=63 /DNA_END=995 /DNA_ORIENTATION=+